MNWQSTPPPGGPSFNQMLVLLLITAFVIIGTLIMFEPKLRQQRPLNIHTQPQPNQQPQESQHE